LKSVKTRAEGEKLHNRYLIIHHLAAGGVAKVYEALDERSGIPVAIKEKIVTVNEQQLRRAFLREAKLLAQVSHPALPRAIDYFIENDREFIVMQFIGSHDLSQIISHQTHPFPPEQVITWADQLLDALIYLHTRQIIHRDIQPQNVRLTHSGQIALVDFGLAESMSQPSPAVAYTLGYSPLEQLQGHPTQQSDIYALGATLYHLLTGVQPADALTRAAALTESKPDPLRPADEIQPVVGLELSRVLQKATALKASDRYESASEFRAALRTASKDSQVSEGGVVAESPGPERQPVTYAELIKAIIKLPVKEREAVRDAISKSVEDEQLKPKKRSLSQRLYGIAKPDGPIPSDLELKEDYVRYLTEKYS
jgi:eukaryotic-like serine/threonine-protein kinase